MRWTVVPVLTVTGLDEPVEGDERCVGADAGVKEFSATVEYACPTAVSAPAGVMKVGRPL